MAEKGAPLQPGPGACVAAAVSSVRQSAPRAVCTLILVAILAVGAGLRFWNLGLVRHNYDDSYPSYDALRILDGYQPLLSGQASSVFLDNPAGAICRPCFAPPDARGHRPRHPPGDWAGL